MKDNNCIFCKIANGEIPTRTVYENEQFRVILDNGPATEGHALVLPKDHYADLFEIPQETAAEAIKTAQTVARLLKDKLHVNDCLLVNLLLSAEFLKMGYGSYIIKVSLV